MDRSLFLARLVGPTFVAIALVVALIIGALSAFLSFKGYLQRASRQHVGDFIQGSPFEATAGPQMGGANPQ